LAQRHQIGVSLLVEPAPFNDELLPEIADVRDGAAEAAYTELRESAQNLERGPGRVTRFDRHAGRHSVHSDASDGAFARVSNTFSTTLRLITLAAEEKNHEKCHLIH
jgi:hypothetical protein